MSQGVQIWYLREQLRGLDTLPGLSVIFNKGDNCCDFLFAYKLVYPLLKGVYSYRKEFTQKGVYSFLLEWTFFQKGDKIILSYLFLKVNSFPQSMLDRILCSIMCYCQDILH